MTNFTVHVTEGSDGFAVIDGRTDVEYHFTDMRDAETLRTLLLRADSIEVLGGGHGEGFVYAREPGTVAE